MENKQQHPDSTTKIVRDGLRELIAGYRALAIASIRDECHLPKESSSCPICRELGRAKRLLGMSGEKWSK